MSVDCISFLQLGDIHYPDLLRASPLADHKDKGMSAEMVGVVSSSRISEIARGVTQVREDEGELVAVVLTGDLTTRGDAQGYENCLKFLYSALQFSGSTHLKDIKLIAVPGNHDINRGAIVSGQSLDAKFIPLQDEWVKIFGEKNYLSVDEPKPTDLPLLHADTIGPSIRFLPLNTCYLCGEYRLFPDAIRGKMLDLLEQLRKSIESNEFEKIMSEQVDCPAVSRDHVNAMERLIVNNGAESISVVVGHHPLFAQPMPRIDGYNELLNAGYVRETVLETRKNVIYLHGHIHQDPLLLINSPVRGSHRIIHISAPALEDGFNLIKIFFSRISNQPLGLELIRYRFGDHLGLIRQDPIKIRLIDQDTLWSEIDNPWATYVLDKLKTPGAILRFNDLLKSAPKTLTHGVSSKDQSISIQDALTVLELLELVDITNREKSNTLWQCRRKSI